MIKNLFKKKEPKLGSPEWLVETEKKYGGYHKNVKRNKVSDKDHRSAEKIAKGGMRGGDRMSTKHHGYAKKYAEYLSEFLNDRETIVAEFGILRGIGLAIWCDLFPNGLVYGFDIDLGHTKNNMDSLIKLGAFAHNKPILHEYDQLEKQDSYLHKIFGGKKIDVCIDDGLHTDESILITLESALPHLNKGAVYIIEDNKNVHVEIKKRYSHLLVDNIGELTILKGF